VRPGGQPSGAIAGCGCPPSRVSAAFHGDDHLVVSGAPRFDEEADGYLLVSAMGVPLSLRWMIRPRCRYR
jgi:hypothetical protein